ncbi:MAG: phasin family protein [Lysobacter sp.]|nr:phasin family protein [Lysobacter sp.]
MATFKKSAKKSTAKKTSAASSTDGLGRTLSESAQQIWLAGMGAFGRAQSEGTRLFEGLVKEGLNLEQTARKLAGGQADAVRDAVESKVGHARERAADTWDRLERVFEDRVQRAMNKLGVPGREDLNELSRRVDALTAQLRQSGAARPAAKTPAKRTTRAATKATKAPAKKAAKKAARKAVPTRARKTVTPPSPPAAS